MSMSETPQPTPEMPGGDRAAQILAEARAIMDDLHLGAVKAWKADHPGALAVGYLPVYAPRPLLEALGCLPVAIFGGGDQVDIIRGDSYFQSYICHIPRSTIELGLSGHLSALDGMVFPSLCDVIRNLGGMWKMLFPERYSTYLDLPQNFNLQLGGKFYAQELRRIARELHARGAKAYEPEALRAALRLENRRRAAIAQLDDLRRREPWRLPASDAYVLMRAGGVLSAAQHLAMLDEFLAAVKTRPARPFDNVRVVMVGSFCEQPPLDLVRTLEKSGCDIVDDDLQLGLRYVEAALDADAADPLEALANGFIQFGTATSSRYIGEAVKGAALLEKVRLAKADGVVFAAASFCDPALLDQPMLEAALDRAGVPFTSFKFSENTGQFQVIREQAGAFSDSVKLWGSVQ